MVKRPGKISGRRGCPVLAYRIRKPRPVVPVHLSPRKSVSICVPEEELKETKDLLEESSCSVPISTPEPTPKAAEDDHGMMVLYASKKVLRELWLALRTKQLVPPMVKTVKKRISEYLCLSLIMFVILTGFALFLLAVWPESVPQRHHK